MTNPPEDKKSSYSYEYYNEDPGLKVIYNANWGASNRNKSLAKTGTEFWLSSRCVDANLGSADFYLRYMSGSGSLSYSRLFYSGTGTGSVCSGLRPVLQVSK